MRPQTILTVPVKASQHKPQTPKPKVHRAAPARIRPGAGDQVVRRGPRRDTLKDRTIVADDERSRI